MARPVQLSMAVDSGSNFRMGRRDLKVAAIITAQDEAVGAAYFCHRPLVSWSIVQAQRATTIERVFVQTDSQRIGEIAGSYGVPVISGEPIHRETAWSTISDLAPPISLDSRLAKTAGPERKGRDGPEAEGEQGDRRS